MIEPEKGLPLRRHSEICLILDTPKGRGIFARSFIPAHTVIETCPVLVLDPVENKEHIEKTLLYHYTYEIERKKKSDMIEPEKGLPLRRHSEICLILDTPKGRGIFARSFIPAHTVIETCPVLVLDPVENKEHIEKTLLYHYTYEIEGKKNQT